MALTNLLRSKIIVATACSVLGLSAFAPTVAAQDSEPAAQEPPAGSVGGMGDINLYPKRIVIDGRQRIATVGIYNRTVNDGDYEIEISNMMMTEDGRLLQFNNFADDAAKARVKTALDMLRWSPKRVRLLGNEAQTIRLMARPPADLPDGEYRSHFMAVAIPDSEDLGFSIDDATSANTDPNSIGVTIRPRFGIAIPVIVRIGETTLDVGLVNPQVVNAEQGGRAIGLTITRAGTRSAFGDIEIKHKGTGQRVSISKGVGVYPEVDSRQVALLIDPEIDPALVAPGSRLEIIYTDDDYEPGAILARQEFVVP